MLDVIGLSLGSWLWGILGTDTPKVPKLEPIVWHEASIFDLPQPEFDPQVQIIVDQYIDRLVKQGILGDRQGIWIQSDWFELGNHYGDRPIPSASLTKIATSLAAIGTWGADYQFITHVYHTGKIESGRLKGDLIIEGGNDPFFVWEEAIALSNSLNELGITSVSGDLLITDNFAMNYRSDPRIAGSLLYQSLNTRLWSSTIKRQFQTLSAKISPTKLNKPNLTIEGTVRVISKIPNNPQSLVDHYSLPLVSILRHMNIYSNNKMAQILASNLGGSKAIANYAVKQTRVPPQEIQLINGSGLGLENRISPRAATKMLIAIENLLEPNQLDVVDVFPVSGRDQLGTIADRQLPVGIGIKTGTLNEVSALSGVIPLQGEKKAWFTITNYGWQIQNFRKQQDQLVQELVGHWQPSQPSTPSNPTKTVTLNQRQKQNPQNFATNLNYLGDPQRNQIKAKQIKSNNINNE